VPIHRLSGDDVIGSAAATVSTGSEVVDRGPTVAMAARVKTVARAGRPAAEPPPANADQTGAPPGRRNASAAGRLRQARRPAWLVAALFVVAVGVFASGVSRPVFWVDEYLTQLAIARPWSDLVQQIVTSDPGPGPYYLGMKIWSAVSSAPGWMRLPSVFAAAGAVVVFAVLVRRLTDTMTAALAAAVLLVLPNVSRYAQEHRPYAFALLFSVLAVTMWHISVTRDRSGGARSRWWSAGFAVAAAGMGLAHVYTLALLPALAMPPSPGRLRIAAGGCSGR